MSHLQKNLSGKIKAKEILSKKPFYILISDTECRGTKNITDELNILLGLNPEDIRLTFIQVKCKGTICVGSINLYQNCKIALQAHRAKCKCNLLYKIKVEDEKKHPIYTISALTGGIYKINLSLFY